MMTKETESKELKKKTKKKKSSTENPAVARRKNSHQSPESSLGNISVVSEFEDSTLKSATSSLSTDTASTAVLCEHSEASTESKTVQKEHRKKKRHKKQQSQESSKSESLSFPIK